MRLTTKGGKQSNKNGIRTYAAFVSILAHVQYFAKILLNFKMTR